MKTTSRTETLKQKKLVGKRMSMSLAQNKTVELWKSFMPQRNEITNTLTKDLISMQVYQPNHFKDFDPTRPFEKWAVVEVDGFENIPQGMETFILESGLYAVFDYKGPSNDAWIFQHIFQVWLPASEYVLDGRPHFEVLSENYKNNDPDSEEEIWIPIRLKEE